MTAAQDAVRAGLARGWIESRNYFRSRDELLWNIFLAVVFAVVLFFQRNSVVEGTDQSLASVVLPGILGMTVAWGGLSGAAGILAIEREDGTLLRAKAIPHGMVGYVVAKAVMTAVTSAVTVIIILVAGLLFVPELVSTPWTGWLMMVGILVLGLLATMPWGAIIGSLVKSPQGAFGLTFLPWRS
jgi:ABC-2 type transport system permease protein